MARGTHKVNPVGFRITVNKNWPSRWFATKADISWGDRGGGVSKFDGKYWTTYNTYTSGITSNLVDDIAVDYQNNIWVY